MRLSYASTLVRLVVCASLAPAALGCGDDDKGKLDTGGYIYPDLGNNKYPDFSSKVCSVSSCAGCCGNNQCLPGNTTSACGYGGNTCQTCESSQQCQAGICVAPKCDSTTCANGCCDSSGKCQKGTSDSACGTSGAKCSVCKSSEACTSYKCQPKSSALFKVILYSAKKVSSYSCDTFGKCDFYVELTVDTVKATSTTKDGNDAPVWNETLLTASGAQIIKKFYAKVYDDDWPMDQYVGECKPTVTNSTLAAGTLTVECGSYSSMGFLKTVTVTFKFQGV